MSKRQPTLKEQTIAEIREAAVHLPESYRHYRRIRRISGDKLLLSGIRTVGGEKPVKGQIYDVDMPIPHKVNHADEMIKLYTENFRKLGHDGAYQLVADYIQSVQIEAEA